MREDWRKTQENKSQGPNSVLGRLGVYPQGFGESLSKKHVEFMLNKEPSCDPLKKRLGK